MNEKDIQEKFCELLKVTKFEGLQIKLMLKWYNFRAMVKNVFCVSSVLRRFYLQQGDTVIVFSQGMYKYTEAIGFNCFGMVSTDITGFVPCAPGLFYGVGYSADGTRYITVKKLWHYRPAVACEWLRLKLPFNAGIYVFGFKKMAYNESCTKYVTIHPQSRGRQ